MSSEEESRRIFFAYRTVFTGKNARLRKAKHIRRVALQHWPKRKALLQGYGFRRTVRVLKTLLTSGRFESQTATNTRLNNTTVKDTQKCDKSIRFTKSAVVPHARLLQQDMDTTDYKIESISQESQGIKASKTPIKGEDNISFSVQRSQFPYKIQHDILSGIQNILEESCFDFARQRLPTVLSEQGWTCAAAGELTAWLFIFKRHSNSENLPFHNSTFDSISSHLRHLRNTAVHRTPLPTGELINLLQYAVKLTDMLRDPVRTRKLQDLLTQVQSHLHEMEQKKMLLESEISSQLFRIQKQQEALDIRKNYLLAYGAEEESRLTNIAGELLQGLIERIHTVNNDFQSNGGCPKETNVDGVISSHDLSWKVEEEDIESDEERLMLEL
ncbi:uncharacterized protein K452DRAFT_260619 [Aplosporella prunicola CBS 121167]|uniref:Uncharacterized protein n=1 Tax=Aplosporella prunicola CBS 121167 TaxID=1176127 RepID=A0A6A6AXG8_9PEZI|nr:uncharacterized protein K452DRAFT_260619 [Aplosporella prunicola CBS 121167]KAF2135477.1 hypothetical protein K452DRAFT_260619 [Aplosporella prunicola CBS 121167]